MKDDGEIGQTLPGNVFLNALLQLDEDRIANQLRFIIDEGSRNQ